MTIISIIFIVVIISFIIINDKKYTNNKVKSIKKEVKKNEDKKYIETKNIYVSYVFTKYESIFYNELKNFFTNKKDYIILSKVRIADFIKSKGYSNYSEYMKVFNKINRKHIDFIIADTKGKIYVLIELDGNSHNNKSTIESDNFKNQLFKDLNIPLIRFKNGYTHNLTLINKYL